MFELESQEATIKSVTPRAERHGEDTVPAVSIGVSITAANTILDRLSPTLRRALYTAPEGQEQLPGVDEHLPLLRTPDLGAIHLDCKTLEGWTMHIDWGIDDQGSIDCGGCKVDKWRLNALQGGSVELEFRIGTSDVDADSMGKLGMLLGQEVDITLTAPVPKADPIDGSPEGGGPGFKKPDPDATDLFVASGTGGGPSDGDEDGGSGSEGGDPDVSDAEPRSDLQRAAVKYRSPQTGETWSGRGRKPAWLEKALATGQRLEDFLVERVAA